MNEPLIPAQITNQVVHLLPLVSNSIAFSTNTKISMNEDDGRSTYARKDDGISYSSNVFDLRVCSTSDFMSVTT